MSRIDSPRMRLSGSLPFLRLARISHRDAGLFFFYPITSDSARQPTSKSIPKSITFISRHRNGAQLTPAPRRNRWPRTATQRGSRSRGRSEPIRGEPFQGARLCPSQSIRPSPSSRVRHTRSSPASSGQDSILRQAQTITSLRPPGVRRHICR